MAYDYLPDLSPSKMASAIRIEFEYDPFSDWENVARYWTTEDYALLRSTFVVTLTEGATYDIQSSSFFDPFILILYDSTGDVVAIDTDQGSYGYDYIFNYQADYTGNYFISASWDQGLADSHKYVSLNVYEDIDTILAGNPFPEPTPTPDPEPSPNEPGPTVVTFAPGDDALSVAIATNISVTFDEVVLRGDAQIILKTLSGEIVEVFETSTSNRLSISSNTLTINPTEDLNYSTGYRVEFEAGAITDTTGNGNDTIEDYNFATENEPVVLNNAPEGVLLLGGDAILGSELYIEPRGISDADGLGSFYYQWLRGDVEINGATEDTYQIAEEDLGELISVAVSYTDGNGTFEELQSEARLPSEATSPSYTDLIEMYVIILGRAPAQGGLDFWSSIINDGEDFEYVAGEMWNSAGAREFYPADMSTEEVVTSVYTNILVREPQESGLNYWVDRWEDQGPVDTMLEMIGALTANNSSDPLAIADKVLFQSKVDIGGYLANTVQNTDVDLASAAFNYLESGYSVEETKQFIDNEMGIVGQANVSSSEDLFA